MPLEIGLLGFDNEDWADLCVPTVSTIVQPAYQEGATAARTAYRLYKKPK